MLEIRVSTLPIYATLIELNISAAHKPGQHN